MTKNAPDDILKFHLTVEEPKKLVEENTQTICNAQTTSLADKLEMPQIKAEIKPQINTLETVMPKLYNLEECTEPEKPVKINLDIDLYQMEKV